MILLLNKDPLDFFLIVAVQNDECYVRAPLHVKGERNAINETF